MRIDCTTLPVAEIDHPVVRESAERHAAAAQALKQAQRALAKLDGGREQAQSRDADEAVATLMADKPAPKRHHEADFDKALDAAEHEVRVARAVVQQSLAAYQQAVDAHLSDSIDDANEHAALVDQAWDAAVAGLQTLHQDRVRAHQRPPNARKRGRTDRHCPPCACPAHRLAEWRSAATGPQPRPGRTLPPILPVVGQQ